MIHHRVIPLQFEDGRELEVHCKEARLQLLALARHVSSSQRAVSAQVTGVAAINVLVQLKKMLCMTKRHQSQTWRMYGFRRPSSPNSNLIR